MKISNRMAWAICGCLALAVVAALNPAAGNPAAAPKLTHEVAGREKCLICHTVKTGMKPAPEDHAGRTADLCLFCHATKDGKAAGQPLPGKAQADFCLGCHGPFDKLAKRTAAFTTADGEKANPHINVPHKSDKITNCGECHEVHALPVAPETKVKKATLQYCYAACHHEKDFTPCVQCHKDR